MIVAIKAAKQENVETGSQYRLGGKLELVFLDLRMS